MIGDPVLITPPVAHRGGEAFSLLDPTIHPRTSPIAGMHVPCTMGSRLRADASRGIPLFYCVLHLCLQHVFVALSRAACVSMLR